MSDRILTAEEVAAIVDDRFDDPYRVTELARSHEALREKLEAGVWLSHGDAETVRETLEIMRDCGDRPGFYFLADTALALLGGKAPA